MLNKYGIMLISHYANKLMAQILFISELKKYKCQIIVVFVVRLMKKKLNEHGNTTARK